MDRLTIGRRMLFGYALLVLATIVVGVVGFFALQRVIERKDAVIEQEARFLVEAAQLNGTLDRKAGLGRAALLSGDPETQDGVEALHGAFVERAAALRAAVADPSGIAAVDAIVAHEAQHHAAWGRIFALRDGGASNEEVLAAWRKEILPVHARLQEALDAFVATQQALLESERDRSRREAERVSIVLAAIVGLAGAAGILLAWQLTTSLTGQIEGAVSSIHSASTELQAGAAQQATGAREQATALTEVGTTMAELLATSRQIATSAQRVAQIAEEAVGGARAGEGIVERTQEAMGAMRRQIDAVVTHMLDLGRKSQQVGSIVEIVAELADQTNILAINATIEAAGAGEGGRRFAVVADEIRKLADRVGGSTREIRDLVAEVRAAANTTVMATEAGQKAVDAGTRQFVDVAAAFGRIATAVGTTTEAAREIELSTKQQATAVEQVNAAIHNVAQASQETEASSAQTVQTAAQLAQLSDELSRLVRPKA